MTRGRAHAPTPAPKSKAPAKSKPTAAPARPHRAPPGAAQARNFAPLHPNAERSVVQLRASRTGAAAAGLDTAVHAAALAGVGGAGLPLPYLDRIQRAFGDAHDLTRISAHVGGAAGEASSHLGADGYAVGDRIAFRTAPDLRLAAHEAAHVVQQLAGVHLSGGIGRNGDTYEQSADAVAERVVQGRSATELLPAASQGTARAAVQLDESNDPALLDRSSDATALRYALSAGNGTRVLEILSHNADRGSMWALRRAYEAQTAAGTFGRDLRARLTTEQFARASGIAGEQIALDVRIASHDTDAIFGILEGITDAEALALVISSIASITLAAGNAPAPAWSTLAAVRAALRQRLSPDDDYRAMRLILEMAERELARHPTVVESDLAGLSGPGGAAVMNFLTSSAIGNLRVDLVEERVRAANGWPGTKNELDAYLATADLDASARRALAHRLTSQPLIAGSLPNLPLAQTDDATAIRDAIVTAGARPGARRGLPDASLEVALERAGALLRTARAKARDPKLPQPARNAANKEIERLRRMFHESHAVLSVLGSDTETRAERLKLLEADPVTLGAERLSPVWASTDVPGLIATLKKIPAEHRRAAMGRANKLADVQQLPDDKRELIEAYLEVGLPPVAPAPGTIVVVTPNFATREVKIALADVLEGIARGPAAAHLVLARLQRLPYDERKVLFAQPEYKRAVAASPRGAEKSEQRDFVNALARAEQSDIGPELAIQGYPGPAGPYQQVLLERVRIVGDRVGRANLRRGFVLHERVKNNADARAALSPSDAIALKHYEEITALKPTFGDPKQAEIADDLAFGSIQLAPTAESGLDPNTEARFMHLRLRRVSGVAPGQALTNWPGSPEAIEALTAFQTLFAIELPGGVTRDGLAQLAEIYYRALREVEKHKIKLAENEALASIAATVAGVVVVVGITLLTGGTALPLIAVAGLSGTAAGIASAAAGAAVRINDTTGSMLRDFGSGFVEGVTSIASAGLAARIVRSATAGVSAGKAAASAGSRAVEQATRSKGAASIAEAAIDGAFSGAAGDLFQTAVDEATWDRGVGEAIAKMLAAIARGGALGGAGGGLMGGLAKLARRVGAGTAENVGNLLDASIGREAADGMTDQVQDELARAVILLQRGQIEEAEKVIRSIKGISDHHRQLLINSAREQALFVRGEISFPDYVDDAKFRALAGAGNQDAHAIVVIRGGKPTVVTRKGTPLTSLREEFIHLRQWESKLAMRGRMEKLSEENLKNWPKLAPHNKLELHVDQLELEADAQRQIIRQLSDGEEDAETALRILDAEEALVDINARLQLLRAARPPLDVARLDIDRVPRIFSSTAQSGKASGPGSRRALGLIGDQAKVDNPKVLKLLDEIGYNVHRIEGTGPIFRLTRKPGKSNLPHLSIENGKIVAGKPRQSFDSIKADAVAEWATTQRDLMTTAFSLERRKLGKKATEAARDELARSGYRSVRPELQRLVKAGQIDAGTAGLIANWGGVLEDLEGRFNVSIKDLLAKHLKSKSITESELSAFRGELREIAARGILSMRGRKRFDVLHKVLEMQPDNASKGHLFREYRREAMRIETVGSEKIYGVSDGLSPESFYYGRKLDVRRTPDDVIHIHGGVPGKFAPGRYAVEDKTGKGAFKIEQAEDYAKRSFDAGKPGGGFRQTDNGKKVYDGLIYTFSDLTEANTARKAMNENTMIKNILGKKPGGIHIMYIDQFGKVRLR